MRGNYSKGGYVNVGPRSSNFRIHPGKKAHEEGFRQQIDFFKCSIILKFEFHSEDQSGH